MITGRLHIVCLAVSMSFAAVPAHAGVLSFSCAPENDLLKVAVECCVDLRRHVTPEQAIQSAPEGGGVLLLADGYPEKTTELTPALYEVASKKHLRLYVEYPASLPDMTVGPPKATKLERVVVVSDVFGNSLRPMRIAQINACHILETQATDPWLVLAKVAGVYRAVFGLKDTPSLPVLFEHANGNILAATTKLSHFVTGRYGPQEAWRVIWERVFHWLQPEQPTPKLRWTSTVRPSYSPDEALPPDVEVRTLARAVNWYTGSRVLRHADWPPEALDWANTYNTVREKPKDAWPAGNGALGMLEGFSSTILLDGSQPMRYAVRNDCMNEAAMALAFAWAVDGADIRAGTSRKLLDYVYRDSILAQGPRANPRSPSYGLVGWALDNPGSYWGDDNARAMLAGMATASLLKESRWNEALTRCLLANFRTTDAKGFRESCVTEKQLAKRGWESYRDASQVQYSAHYEGWLWACFLRAYKQTGFAPFLEKSKTAIGMLMAAYPEKWEWVVRSSQIERARALLPLAWLVRAEDTPEHRRWLRTVAQDLVASQGVSGVIRETLGGVRQAVESNAAYGTGEVSLLQQDGDTLCDSLYTCNFALIGLHEAAAATGDAFYRDAEDKLARFLCRIQIRSESHPELDGAWYRGFDFEKWEYWASNADWEWGAWCTESGWGTPWIASTLALRHMSTSLWDLTSDVKLAETVETYRATMLER